MQTYRGKVVGKTVFLDEGADLPEGATVEVRLLPETDAESSDSERQQALAELFALDLPVDDWEQVEGAIIRGAVEA